MNDLPDCVQNKIKLYADDVLLHSVIRSTADCICLQKDLNLLHQWSVLWLMDFNHEFLRITNKKNPIFYQHYIGSSVIKQVSHSKYLGVTINEGLTRNNHILTVVNKARQANNFFTSKLLPVSTLCKAQLISVYHTLLNINRLESIQRSAARLQICYNDFVRTSSVTSMLN